MFSMAFFSIIIIRFVQNFYRPRRAACQTTQCPRYYIIALPWIPSPIVSATVSFNRHAHQSRPHHRFPFYYAHQLRARLSSSHI